MKKLRASSRNSVELRMRGFKKMHHQKIICNENFKRALNCFCVSLKACKPRYAKEGEQNPAFSISANNLFDIVDADAPVSHNI